MDYFRSLLGQKPTPLAAFPNNPANRNESQRRRVMLNRQRAQRIINNNAAKANAAKANAAKANAAQKAIWANQVRAANAARQLSEQTRKANRRFNPTLQAIAESNNNLPIPAAAPNGANQRARNAAKVALPKNQNNIIKAQRKAARNEPNIWNMNEGRSFFQGPNARPNISPAISPAISPPIASPAISPSGYPFGVVPSSSRRNRRRHNTTPGLARAQARKAEKLHAEIQRRNAARKALLANNGLGNNPFSAIEIESPVNSPRNKRLAEQALKRATRAEKNVNAFVSPVGLYGNNTFVENIGSNQNKMSAFNTPGSLNVAALAERRATNNAKRAARAGVTPNVFNTPGSLNVAALANSRAANKAAAEAAEAARFNKAAFAAQEANNAAAALVRAKALAPKIPASEQNPIVSNNAAEAAAAAFAAKLRASGNPPPPPPPGYQGIYSATGNPLAPANSNALQRVRNRGLQRQEYLLGAAEATRQNAQRQAAANAQRQTAATAANAAAAHFAKEAAAAKAAAEAAGIAALPALSGNPYNTFKCTPCEENILAKIDTLLDRSKPSTAVSNALASGKKTIQSAIEASLLGLTAAGEAGAAGASAAGEAVMLGAIRIGKAVKAAANKVGEAATNAGSELERAARIARNCVKGAAKGTNRSQKCAAAYAAVKEALNKLMGLLAAMPPIAWPSSLTFPKINYFTVKNANGKTQFNKNVNRTRGALGRFGTRISQGLGAFGASLKNASGRASSALSRGTLGARNYLSGRTKQRQSILRFIKRSYYNRGIKNIAPDALERWTRELVATGMSADDARIAVINTLGGLNMGPNGKVTATNTAPVAQALGVAGDPVAQALGVAGAPGLLASPVNNPALQARLAPPAAGLENPKGLNALGKARRLAAARASGGKRSRKNRKGSRKNRKASRRNRH